MLCLHPLFNLRESPKSAKKGRYASRHSLPYVAAKLLSEHYARIFSIQYNVETACLRYFNVYGPRQNLVSDYAAVVPSFICRLVNREPPIIFGNGNLTRDFIFVNDVVNATIGVMKDPAKGISNIASGRQTSMAMLAKKLMALFSIQGEPLYQAARAGDVYNTYADISHAAKAFGFRSAYSLEKRLKETVRYFQEHRVH